MSLPARLTTERAALVAFVLGIVVAVPTALAMGSNQWFFLDEWRFLTGRPLWSIDSLLDDHNGQWVTLPFLAWRATDNIWGITTYFPYQLQVVLSHVAVVCAVRAVMRTMGVNAWIATATAAAMLLFGAGNENIVFAFQTTLNGSVLCGLGVLLLTAHDGPINRRDHLALALAVLGLMTSGVMVPMIVGVGVANLVRRGWKPALLHAAVPGTVFIAWYVPYGGGGTLRGSFGQATELFFGLLVSPFYALGQTRLVALVLIAVAVIGVVRTVDRARTGDGVATLSLLLALLAMWACFAAITALNRSGLLSLVPDLPNSSRYLHVGAAIHLPVIALGAAALYERRRELVALPLLALAFGIPGNLDELANRPPFSVGRRNLVVATAHSPLIDQVPDELKPLMGSNALEGTDVSVGWLRDAVADGDIDGPEGIAEAMHLLADLTLAVQQTMTAGDACEMTGAAGATFRIDAGDRIVFAGGLWMFAVSGADESYPARFAAERGNTLEVIAGPLDIRVKGTQGADARLCVVTGTDS